MENEGNSVPQATTASDEAKTENEQQQSSSQQPAQSSDQWKITNSQEAVTIEQNGGKISDKLDGISEMFARLDEMGPTVSRYQYDEASSEVQRLASEMKERAMSTMIHHLRLEDAKTCPRNQTGTARAAVDKLSPAFVDIEIKLKELEKQSNAVTRRINEHKREQAHTLKKIQILEARTLLSETKDFIKDMLMRVPTETDLQNLETIRLMMIQRRRAESRIKLLNMRASALDKAMGSVAKSKWFRQNQVDSGSSSSPSTWEAGVSSFELNGGPSYSLEINSGVSGREVHKKSKLPDFTLMSSSKRDAFLAKHFPQGSTKKAGQESGVAEGGESGIEDRDGIGKSSENSGITIVTLSSNDTSGIEDMGRQQSPDDGEIQDEGADRRTETVGAEDPSRDGSERNTDQAVNK